jgi:site-specific DNA recombinase
MSMTAYAYARFSSSHQREESIDAQLQAIREHCSREGINLTKIFTDEAESARYDDRPGFQAMFSAVRLDPPDIVLVHKLDRFSRDRYDAAVYRRKLKDHGVRLVSVLEPLDGSPESVILESVLEGMAEYYSKNLAREVMKGLRQNAQKCLWNGGRPPLGYVVNKDRKLEIEPEGAATVRRIFDLFLDGHGYKTIAAQLNAEGLKTSVGGPWYKSSIYTILTNERYIGIYLYNKRSSANTDGSRNNHAYKPVDEQIRIEGGVPAIIEKEVWEKVREKMEGRLKGPQPRRRGNVDYILTGLMNCGECGGAFVGGGARSKGYHFYTCTRKGSKACSNPTISQTWIEDRVIHELKKRVLSGSAIDALVPAVMEQVKNRESQRAPELEAIKKKINEGEAKISRLLDMIEDGIAGPDVKDRIMERREEINTLHEREQALLNSENLTFTEDMVRRYLLTYRESLESEDPAIKRKTLETFVERIEVFSDRVEFQFKIEPGQRVDKVGGDGPNRTLSPVGNVGEGEPFWTLSTMVTRVGKSGNGGNTRRS